MGGRDRWAIGVIPEATCGKAAALVTRIRPAADVCETHKEFPFELQVPGFEEKELSAEVHDHTLVVKGEQLRPRTRRTSSTVSAEFTKGVLTVLAPKVDISKPRKVAIAPKQ